MSKTDILRIPDYLGHSVEAIEWIHRYVEDMSEVSFLGDEKTQDAIIRNFEIIGEAACNIKRYHSDYVESNHEVPWIFMYAMHNRIAHGYFKVDFELVWKTIHEDSPRLHEQVRHLIEDLSSTLSDYMITIFQVRHSGMDCRNPYARKGVLSVR